VKLKTTCHITQQASVMQAPRFGTKSKQSSKQPY